MVELKIRKANACVIVLGDIGRSPRMQYHSQSLLEEDFNVDLIGYVETKPMEILLTSKPQCKIYELTAVPVTNLTPILKLIFKTIWQTLSLLIALISIRRPNLLILQNPPGIPTLFVCYFYCLVLRCKLIIDWHNYTYTVLALGFRKGENSRICRIAKWMEGYFGAKANAHFCVTKAMKENLKKQWNVGSTTVLYDRPPKHFQSIDLNEKHELFMKLSVDYNQFSSKCEDLNDEEVMESTALTQKLNNGTVVFKPDRVGILVSSTSWTADEDFGVLLKALEEYEEAATKDPQRYCQLLCIITGKGPEKQAYTEKIGKLKWQSVEIITPWLETNDYPLVLASADLGVCLHWSTSGLDLPMKVVDMFGCGLPVCAFNFNCLTELVRDGYNGFTFENYHELAEQIKLWFEYFPNNPSVNETKTYFRRNLHEFQQLRWHENWKLNALSVINNLI